jgi:HK97 family phage portal protein
MSAYRAANRGLMFDLGAGRANRETMMRTYGQSGTVFSIVSLLQQSAATPRWHVYKKSPQSAQARYATSDDGSDQRQEVMTHPALQLWNKPNQFMSGFEFREGCNQHFELTGETFWVLDMETVGFPTSMWYVRPDRMEPVPDPGDYLIGWIYTGPDGSQTPLRLNEVIQEKMPDPLDPFRGAGPVASIIPNIQQQRYATDYQRNLFLNGADPGGMITVPNKMQPRDFDEMVERWREMHQGIARAGRVGVLENGATFAPTGQNNKDMDYANLRLNNRDELREAWRMHKSMLGTVEDVNRANAQTAEETFVSWQDLPRLERRRDTLNHKLLPLYGTSGQGIEFDFDDPSPVNQEAAVTELNVKATAAATLVTAGWDPDDVLEVVGLPSMDVVEKATQLPALPPGWVAGTPAPAPGAPAPAAPDNQPPQDQDMAARLRRMLANGHVPVEPVRR